MALPERVVLVTGSRTWKDEAQIHQALLSEEKPDHQMVLVHGACYQGADKIADTWARQRGWLTRPYPAVWTTANGQVDRSAGPKRNRYMVQHSKPHVALAFCDNHSRGTTNCIMEINNHQAGGTSRLESPVKVFQK